MERQVNEKTKLEEKYLKGEKKKNRERKNGTREIYRK